MKGCIHSGTILLTSPISSPFTSAMSMTSMTCSCDTTLLSYTQVLALKKHGWASWNSITTNKRRFDAKLSGNKYLRELEGVCIASSVRGRSIESK